MNDPYVVLGVKPSASDEEVKRAYRDLVKKYHPDNYQNNPLASLAEEKMKEVNEAYDAIVRQRASGGYQTGGGYQSGYGAAGSDPTLAEVRRMIQVGNYNEAQRLLVGCRTQNAEWHFLNGMLAYQRGFLDEARQGFMRASSMEPNNMEYRQALNHLNSRSGQGGGVFSRGGGRGMTTSDLCTALACYSCLCDNDGCC